MSAGWISTGEAARLVGMSPRQVSYLARTGLVVPSLRRAAGPGTPARYAFADLLALALIQRVRAVAGADIRIERLRGVVRALTNHQRSEPGALLLLDDDGAWVEQESLLDALKATGALLVVSLDAVEAALRARLGRAGLALARSAA